MRKAAVLVAIACLGGAWYLALPPRVPVGAAARQPGPGGVRGAFHVHTDRSDGTGTVDAVAAAAARAGLQFVVFTDHGVGTRPPDAPRYHSGVLCIDAVEISTTGGHVVALGLPRSPYPLGGDTGDVIEDITRMGGFAVAAHPGSLKPELAWADWTLPAGGVEWLNGDSEWRDESRWTLLKALLTYPARRTETLAALLDRPDPVLRQWDAVTRERRIVALAASDAHARFGFRSVGEPYDNGASLHVPSYESMFRVFSNVVPGVSLTGDAAADAARVIAEIRSGHVYSSIDAIGGAGSMTFTAVSENMRAEAGDVMPAGAAVTLFAEHRGSPTALVRLLKDGDVVRSEAGSRLEHVIEAGTRGVYRIEVVLPDEPGRPRVPWLMSNPIYVGDPPKFPNAVERRPPVQVMARYVDGPATAWTIETSPSSKAALDAVSTDGKGTQLALRYAVGGAASASPYVAFVLRTDPPTLAEYDRLAFTARADRPTRMSVQLRSPAGTDGERWRRSVFIDTEPREITVYFDELRSVAGAPPQPGLATVDSILFVLDTINTPLGGSGRIWIDDVKYAR